MNNILLPLLNQTYQDYINLMLENRPNVKDKESYQERHHIIPKTLGGLDNDENLIWLYAEEHYYAHKLLALENPSNQGLQLAWWNMCQCTQNGKRVYNISAEDYAMARKCAAKASSESKLGVKLTKEHRESLKGRGKAVINVTTGESYISAYEAANQTGFSVSHIFDCCKGKRGSCGKDTQTQKPYIWRFVGEENKDFGYIRFYTQKQVICLETKEVFDSIREANRITGAHRGTILRDCCKKCNRQKKDRLHFAYYEDYINN